MPKEKSKLEKLMKIMQAADEEMFETLGVPQKQRTPRFAQILREAAFEPPGRQGVDRQISAEPGPRYRTPVSPERVGPPAPYEYIGDELEARYPRAGTRTASWRDSPWPQHSPPPSWPVRREMELRAQGYTPQPYGTPPAPQSFLRDLVGLEPPGRPTDTRYADPRNREDTLRALEILREKK